MPYIIQNLKWRESQNVKNVTAVSLLIGEFLCISQQTSNSLLQ